MAANYIKDDSVKELIISSTFEDYDVSPEAQEVIKKAAKQIGKIDNRKQYKENNESDPPILNTEGEFQSIYGVWYLGTNDKNKFEKPPHGSTDPDYTEWCGMFVSWVFDKAHHPLGPVQFTLENRVIKGMSHRGYSGVVSGKEFWDRYAHLPFHDSPEKDTIPNDKCLMPQTGDIVLYKLHPNVSPHNPHPHYDHTGIFLKFETFPNEESAFFYALEGNTIGPDSGSSSDESSGGQVALKRRDVNNDHAIFIHPRYRASICAVDVGTENIAVIYNQDGFGDYTDGVGKKYKVDVRGQLFEVDSDGNLVRENNGNPKKAVGKQKLRLTLRIIKDAGNIYRNPKLEYEIDFFQKGNASTTPDYKTARVRVHTAQPAVRTNITPNSVLQQCRLKENKNTNYAPSESCKFITSSIQKDSRILKISAAQGNCKEGVFQVVSGYNKKSSRVKINVEGLTTCAVHLNKVAQVLPPPQIEQTLPNISSVPFEFPAYSNSQFCFFPLQPDKFVYTAICNTHSCGTESRVEVFPDTKVKLKLESQKGNGKRLQTLKITGSFEEDENKLTEFSACFNHHAFLYRSSTEGPINYGLEKINIYESLDYEEEAAKGLKGKIIKQLALSAMEIYRICDVVPYFQNSINKISRQSPAWFPIDWPKISFDGNWGWQERTNDPKCQCEFKCILNLAISPLITIGRVGDYKIGTALGVCDLVVETGTANEFKFKVDFSLTEDEMRTSNLLTDQSVQSKVEIIVRVKNSDGEEISTCFDEHSTEPCKIAFLLSNFRCENNAVKLDISSEFSGLRIKGVNAHNQRINKVISHAVSTSRTIKII